MRSLLIITIFLLFAGTTNGTEPPSDALWSGAVEALTRGDPVSAEGQFSRWILEKESFGVYSPEAHYNLGLAFWNQQKRGPAVHHWMRSATLQPTFFSRWRSLDLLADVEKDLGMKDGVSDTLEFRLWVLFAQDLILGLATVAFWTLSGCLLIAWTQGGRSYRTAKMLGAIPAFLLLVAVAGGIFRKTTFDFGVLDGPQGVTVYRVADNKEEYKLVQLPSGTIAASTRRDRDFIHITQPVAGWVSASTFQPVSDR